MIGRVIILTERRHQRMHARHEVGLAAATLHALEQEEALTRMIAHTTKQILAADGPSASSRARMGNKGRAYHDED